MKVNWKKVPVTDALMSDGAVVVGGRVLLHPASRFRGCRKWLRAHRARDGRYYVLVGARGHDRRYLAPVAWQTFLDGELASVQFWTDGTQPPADEQP